MKIITDKEQILREMSDIEILDEYYVARQDYDEIYNTNYEEQKQLIFQEFRDIHNEIMRRFQNGRTKTNS